MAEKGTDELFMDTPTVQLNELICSSTDLEHHLGEFIVPGRHEITILLSGKTGAGKSHLTNALIGEELAEEGEELDPQTDDVSYFASKIMTHRIINNFSTVSLHTAAVPSVRAAVKT